jgi:FMN-dependent NADH-azoreductase
MSKKVLHLISSPQGEISMTKKLGKIVIEKIQDKYPDTVVRERDLVSRPFPHLDQLQIGAWFTAVETHTPEQARAITVSDDAIAEMQEADIYVINAPFYNFSIPTTLKAYLDHIVRPGITFRYNENGEPEGLLKNKKAYITIASSGVYSEGRFQYLDYVTPYLKMLLGFIGITDITFIRVEGTRLKGIKETAFERGVASIAID